MEFNEKLQDLRKQKGITQEELAQALYVSRTAISKWESGRGYPNLDSLKAIAAYFGVTVDALLSGKELLTVAVEETRTATADLKRRVYSLLDLSVIMLLFFPFFGESDGTVIREVSLLALTNVAPYMRIAYFAVMIATALFGVVTLVVHLRHHHLLSLICSGAGVLLFILSPQPYAAALLFVFLLIKMLLLVVRR